MAYHVDTNNTVSAPFHEPSTSSNNELTENNNYSYWRPCTALCRILNHLTNDDFAQFPCIPCSYCSRLIYPHSTKWIIRDETIRYPFELSFPETSLTSHPNNSTKIAVCSGCKSHSDGRPSRKLAPIPSKTFHTRKENISHPFIFTPVWVDLQELIHSSNTEL